MSETVLVALIGALGLTVVQMLVRGARWLVSWRRKTQPEKVAAEKVHDAVATADASLLVVARARDQLAGDNDRLRQEIGALHQEMTARDTQHARDRDEWRTERAQLRHEIDDLETKLRETLDEVQSLRRRHGMD